MFSKPTNIGLGENISRWQADSQIQQVKSIGNQPRSGILSPNVIAVTNSRAVSTPAHVQNVRVRVERASDVSSRVIVTFKRDPTDYFFGHALVHVSGYKGNPAPTLVGSGQSPVIFALENTGDPVAVHVQANGSLGPAPISTAPTATMQLVSSPLVTTPTTSGTGITPQAITVIQASLTGASVFPRIPAINTSIAQVFGGNRSLVYALPAGSIAAATGKITIRLEVAANSLILGGAVMARALPNQTSVIDTINITWGGSNTPTLATGSHTSDILNYVADTAHDYYIIIYLDPSNTTGTVAGATTNAIVGCCGAIAGDHRASGVVQWLLDVSNQWFAITGINTA